MKTITTSLLLLGLVSLSYGVPSASAINPTKSCPNPDHIKWTHKHYSNYNYNSWVGVPPEGWGPSITVNTAQVDKNNLALSPQISPASATVTPLGEGQTGFTFTCTYKGTTATQPTQDYEKSISINLHDYSKCEVQDMAVYCTK